MKITTYLYVISEAIPKVAALILLPFLTRFLSIDDFARIAFADAVVAFVSVASILGLNSYILREFFNQKTEGDRKILVASAALTAFSFSFLLTCFLVASILGFSLLGVIQEVTVKLFVLALVANLFDAFCLIALALLRATEDSINYFLFILIRTLVSTIICVALLMFSELGVFAKYIAFGGTGLVFGVGSVIVVLKYCGIRIQMTEVKAGLAFSLPLVTGAFAWVSLDAADRIMLRPQVSLTELGLYSVAYAIGFSSNMLIRGLQKAFEPVLFRAATESNYFSVMQRSKTFFLFNIFLFSLALIIFPDKIISLVAGDKFAAAAPVVIIIASASYLKGIFTFQVLVLMVERVTPNIAKIFWAGAVLNIFLNYIWIPSYGIYGAAVSTLISMLIMLMGGLYYLPRRERSAFTGSVWDTLFLILLASTALFSIYL